MNDWFLLLLRGGPTNQALVSVHMERTTQESPVLLIAVKNKRTRAAACLYIGGKNKTPGRKITRITEAEAAHSLVSAFSCIVDY